MQLYQSSGTPTFRDVFSKTFIAVSLINFLGMTGYYAIFVVMTQFAGERFGCSVAVAGLITGIVVIGCLAGRFFTGRIVNSAGYKRLFGIGIALALATNIFYNYVTNEFILFCIRFLSGIALGIMGTVAGTLIAVITPKAFQGRGIAYYSMSTALALCFGPYVGIAFVGRLGYEGIFWIASSLSALSLLLFLLVSVKEEKKSQVKKKIQLSDFIDIRLVPYCAVVGIFCIGWGNIQAFMAPYAQEFHLEAAASVFFLVYAVAILVSRPFTGKIYDIKGPKPVFYPAILALVFGLILLWTGFGSWAVIAAGVLCGFGFGNIASVGNAYAVSMVPKARYAQATSTFFILFDLGIGSAPFIFGYLVPYAGYSGVFGITALLTAAGIPLYWLVTRSDPPKKHGEGLNFKPDPQEMVKDEG